MALVTTVEQICNDTLQNVACQMMLAACTAPKGRGYNSLVAAMANGNTIEMLACKMEEIAGRDSKADFFIRDAVSIRQSPVIVLIGSKIDSRGVPVCGFCGYADCMNKNQYAPECPCAFSGIDLGIAVGSAVSIAAACKVDNRVMFSVGKAAIELELLGKDIKLLLGIPLTASAKSPFFDR